MMKLLCVLLFALICLGECADNKIQCTISYNQNKISKHMQQSSCSDAMLSQIKKETKASLIYLMMGAYFDQDDVNRPGFSKFFFENANEERGHAIKLIEYLLMRGFADDTNKFFNFPLLNSNELNMNEYKTGIKSLEYAFELESEITTNIISIINNCENVKDYHSVEYLSGEFLEEQHKGERDLAGKIFTLGKMSKEKGYLGEFLFDKKLLNGEV